MIVTVIFMYNSSNTTPKRLVDVVDIETGARYQFHSVVDGDMTKKGEFSVTFSSYESNKYRIKLQTNHSENTSPFTLEFVVQLNGTEKLGPYYINNSSKYTCF